MSCTCEHGIGYAVRGETDAGDKFRAQTQAFGGSHFVDEIVHFVVHRDNVRTSVKTVLEEKLARRETDENA